MGTKNIHCKHGLDKKDEITARRLRARLEAGDVELLNKVKEYYLGWLKKPQSSFDEYIASIDKPLSSALRRVKNLKDIYNSISL